MMRLLALCLLLGACSTPMLPFSAGAGLDAGAPPSAPPELRACKPPMPPPAVPPAPRTVERLAEYAWAEARARWITADRLVQCARQHDALIEWIEAGRE